jgi:cell division septation protein DedD
MGDDFDLFPKRENLDPFSFGKKEKASTSEKGDTTDELFGQEEQAQETLPDLTSLTVDPPEIPSSHSGVPPGPPEEETPAADSRLPPVEPLPSSTPADPDTAPDPMDGIFSDAPTSEEKTFDEPVLQMQEVEETPGEKGPRKTPSPFVVIGGALIIIIGLLYGALTYLKRDKPPLPVVVSTPPVSVEVEPPIPVPIPPPEQGTVEDAGPSQDQPAVETAIPESADPVAPEPPTVTQEETASVPAESTPEPEPAAVSESRESQYSIQVGALILDSSVAELEKKLQGLGYEPVLKKGSTTAMMNMLTVGPFGDADEARAALSRLKEAGVDSNMRRRDDGGAIINAGSYLLEENANSVMKKIRSLGYPVKLLKREARLPMTFVRVGHYPDLEEANRANEELKGRGLDGIVVKLE